MANRLRIVMDSAEWSLYDGDYIAAQVLYISHLRNACPFHAKIFRKSDESGPMVSDGDFFATFDEATHWVERRVYPAPERQGR